MVVKVWPLRARLTEVRFAYVPRADLSTNPSFQYVDMHLDWGGSQFLSKQNLVGLVGYVYQELGCDSGSGDHVGCFDRE
jgi:hypothetical protein